MNFRANLTQPNLFYQPIEPLFRSYLVPGCLIYVIVVPHESMDNYSTVAIYTFKISQHNTLPTIYQTWNMKPRHHFFSYFDYTLLAMFGNFIVAPADSIGQIRFMVQASMIVVALNGALTRMIRTVENGTAQFVLEANLDFANPFEPILWESVIARNSRILVENWSFSFVTSSSLLITFLLIAQNYSKYRPSLNWYKLANIIIQAGFDVCLIAFEGQGPTVRVLFRSSASEKMIILWALMTFVLVNTYKSIFTEDTTAPLVLSPPRTFDDLVSGKFQIYSSPVVVYPKKFAVPVTLTKYRVGESELDAEIHRLSALWSSALPFKLHWTVILILREYSCQTTKDEPPWYCADVPFEKLSEIDPNPVPVVSQEFAKSQLGRIAGISQVVNASYAPNIVGKCEKTAFVAPSIYIKSKMYLLSIFGGKSSHLNRKPYVASVDTVLSRRVYIRLTKFGVFSERVKGKIQKLIEGGLYKFWQDLLIHAHTVGGIGRMPEDKFVQQQLDSNIITVFVMLSVAGGICVMLLLIEVGWGRRKIILAEVRTLRARCRALIKKLYGKMRREMIRVRRAMHDCKPKISVGRKISRSAK
ncbi:hypothetical protein Fcan01_24259 [Folsomia candida]|uniref:Uncharacterized protein n=1 Tax=Folsomia candida TaxID=158441 RepID=A0A226D5P0_FOLCA|nr:hypothetical protein Fcan01_24259 [Folsomia candida]